MATKKETGKKGGFALTPITLSQPVKATDGFTNLVETPAANMNAEKKPTPLEGQGSGNEILTPNKPKTEKKIEMSLRKQSASTVDASAEESVGLLNRLTEPDDNQTLTGEKLSTDNALNENELLKILDADSLDEIYELTDVLRASSLKLYATLVRLADSRGRARVKNHELMSQAGIKGIATLYKQERWLMDLKLLEKKAKPGPHDGSSYVVHKLEVLPLPAEIYEKFDDYLKNQK